jgi:actin-related protein 9
MESPGFIPSLLSVLNTRYVLSPSTGTIFTSELPSNFTTPVATPGTNTPIPGQGGHPLHLSGGHGVNPLLVAATKNMMQPNQHLQVPPGAPPPMMDPQLHHSHRGFSQTPTSIKMVKPPDYFPEWKDPSVSGMEEAAFLGAQVAAKVVFIVDQGNSKGFLTRVEYNEMGPAGIHECAL